MKGRLAITILFSVLMSFPYSSFALDNPSFFKGFTHMNNAHYDEAIMYFNISVKANPDYLPAYSHLALCYERKGDYAKAIEVWGKYSEFDSYFKDTVITHTNLIDKFLKANEYLTANQPNEAIPLLEEIVTTDKYPMSVLWVNAAKALGEIYFKAKAYDRVISLYEKINLYYPKDVTEDILFRYAYSYQQAREFQKAVDVYKKLDMQFKIGSEENIRKYKNMVSLCFEGLGDEAFAQDEYGEAIDMYRTCLDGFSAATNIPRVKQKNQKVTEQLAFFYKTEADTYCQLKKYSKAWGFYEKLLDECPESTYYSYARKRVRTLQKMERHLMEHGKKAFSKGDYEKSLQAFGKLVGMFPEGKNAPLAQLWAGIDYAAMGNYRQSIRELTKVAMQYPESRWVPVAVERMGAYYWQGLKDEESASKVFRYLARKYPESTLADNALYYLGVMSLSDNEYQRAYYYFGKLVKSFPDSNLAYRAKKGIIFIREEVKKQNH